MLMFQRIKVFAFIVLVGVLLWFMEYQWASHFNKQLREVFEPAEDIYQKAERYHFEVLRIIQEERKATVNRACGEWKNTCVRHPESFSGIHSRSYNVGVCDIPECGGSGWRNIIYEMDKNDISIGNNRTISPEDSFKIIVVRHPFQRLAAAYRYQLRVESSAYFAQLSRTIVEKYKHQRNSSNAKNQAYHGSNDVLTFEDFVNFVLYDENAQESRLWQTFSESCNLCDVRYDAILKYETLEEDFNYLQQTLGFQDKYKDMFFKNNFMTVADYKVETSFKQLATNLQDALYKKFLPDFQMFGYQLPTWLCKRNDITNFLEN
ncbi:unnamed protein product [Clavelina lepadiformis]|uniref:Carbohydrate sulfotransferase n=1 Tax=Clavelina lepadiformis TaxID=159417 RepID=A0ABP0GS68_CLALP